VWFEIIFDDLTQAIWYKNEPQKTTHTHTHFSLEKTLCNVEALIGWSAIYVNELWKSHICQTSQNFNIFEKYIVIK
jgi:hypothetical protein